jgi:hypothetical protein
MTTEQVLKILQGYRCSRWAYDDTREAMQLADVLTPTGHSTITAGIAELENLADYIAGQLADSRSEPQCTCVRFTQHGDTVTQHWKNDPDCPVHGARVRAATEGLTLTGLPAEPPAPQDREPHNIMQRYKAERTTLGEAITEIRRYGEECARRAMGKSSFAVSRSETEPVVLPSAHWSKDPLVPYTGCGCVSCVDARVAAASTLSWTEIRLPYESGVTYYSCQHYPPHAMRRNPCDRGCTS